jgi:hypothetical protein
MWKRYPENEDDGKISVEEGLIANIENNTLIPHSSKFQTDPNKIKAKVTIQLLICIGCDLGRRG